MVFNSLDFLFFFPIVVLLYFLLPKRIRYVWLLISSYYFYMCWNVEYAFLLLLSTIITYSCGLLIELVNKSSGNAARVKLWKTICLTLSILFNCLILFFFKYYDFVFENVREIFCFAGVYINVPKWDVLLPVGISFYTFQTMGYIIDVYRNDIYAEKNFIKYALFVSFFPQLVAGPIERSKNLLTQLSKPTNFNVQNVRCGLFTMAYGLFLKMVVADRIAMTINPILSNYVNMHGMVILMCIILFSFQIYCDFHGYTQIAIGAAQILGYHLQENFNAPYFSGSVKEFWRNWHISLTSWFTDYIYIPLGGNRKGKFRTYINTMIVFLVSGVWHGADWNYILWGGGKWSIYCHK